MSFLSETWNKCVSQHWIWFLVISISLSFPQILSSNDPPPPFSFFRRLPFFFRNLSLSCDWKKSWKFYKGIQKVQEEFRQDWQEQNAPRCVTGGTLDKCCNKNAQLFRPNFAHALRKTPALIFKVFQTYVQCNLFVLIFKLQFSLFSISGFQPNYTFTLIKGSETALQHLNRIEMDLVVRKNGGYLSNLTWPAPACITSPAPCLASPFRWSSSKIII